MSLTEITYPCKFDDSFQPAMFRRASAPGPRPLVVALHTWSYTFEQDCTAYAQFCLENNWNFI